jgi:hypothetical protein
MVRAVNEAWFSDARLKAEAEGYQFDRSGVAVMIADDNPDPAQRNPLGIFARNGGLVALRRVELSEHDMMYRFAARKHLRGQPDALRTLLNSPWWMNEDRMVLLLGRARTAAVPLIEMARRQLALPLHWTDCDILVRCRWKPRIAIAAHAGPGRTADGGAGDRFLVAREVPHLFLDQLYVPGLGAIRGDRALGQANAEAWFDLATLRAFDPAARGFNP